MSNGFTCDNCNLFFADSLVQTKIEVAIEPRQYAASATFCSLECFDQSRSSLDDDAAFAAEHDFSRPRFQWRVVEEPVE